MKDWFYAFFMAWGMFLAIPCPFPRWRESARGRMLMCLPLIGLVEGGLWALLVWLLAKLCLPEALGALCAAAFPWLVTGFLHLDGYMDVCDAVLSRRDLATRQKILKDSHCGAFAVIAMVLLALTQWIVCQSVSLNEIPLLPLAALPCAVRAAAALAVSHLRPLSTSQYAAQPKPPAGHTAALILMLAAACVLPQLFCGADRCGGLWAGGMVCVPAAGRHVRRRLRIRADARRAGRACIPVFDEVLSMKLILGGAYQGKLTWAVEQFGLAPDTLCDLAQGFQPGKRCYYHLEAFTRAEELAAPELFPEDAVIISREVGSGVVPMDAAERAWRERHGALLQQLSRRSETVIRIFCGLPQHLKP